MRSWSCQKEACLLCLGGSSHLLHPPLLDESGLSSAATWYAEGFEKRSGINVKLNISSVEKRLPQPVEMALFRALQESLTNVHRHSGSSKVDIRIDVERGCPSGKRLRPGRFFGPTSGFRKRYRFGSRASRHAREGQRTKREISNSVGETWHFSYRNHTYQAEAGGDHFVCGTFGRARVRSVVISTLLKTPQADNSL